MEVLHPLHGCDALFQRVTLWRDVAVVDDDVWHWIFHRLHQLRGLGVPLGSGDKFEVAGDCNLESGVKQSLTPNYNIIVEEEHQRASRDIFLVFGPPLN